MKNLFLIILSSLFITGAWAQTPAPQNKDLVIGEALAPVSLPEVVEVKPGDTKIIALPHLMFIDRMTLEIKTCLFCPKDDVRIAFDGYSYQSVRVDGGLHGYRNKIVNAQVTTRTLEITNTTKCKIFVRQIQVLPRRFMARGNGGYSPIPAPGPVYMPHSEAGAQVSFLIETLLYLGDLVSDRDRIQYVTPLKTAAGKAIAVLNVTPETSQASLNAIQEVLKQLKASEEFIERLGSVEATFDIAQGIQSVQSSLERMVR